MVSFIFPGQGSQYVGMGKDLYERYECAKVLFDNADKLLGFSISNLCFNGPEELLNRTENAQPAILIVSVAALRILREILEKELKVGLNPSYVAGLSLGEYTALVAAGVLKFEDAVLLVRNRGLYMEEAAYNNPGKMLSIIGLSKTQIEEICGESGCEIANLNCPGQIVISGKNVDIEKAIRLAEEKGASRIVELKVSGAFHCSLMNSAGEKLSQDIERYTFNSPSVEVVSNVTAKGHSDIKEIKQNLIQQVSSSTYWEDSVRFMISQGVDLFLEIGPGSILKGLNRKIDPNVKTRCLGKVEQIKVETPHWAASAFE